MVCVCMSVDVHMCAHAPEDSLQHGLGSNCEPPVSNGHSCLMARLFCGQVSQDGKSLLDKLQRPLTPGSSDSLTASANYSKAVHHVLDVIHEVLHHQRQLENIWQHRKVRLHQRLQLCVFQQDVQQVSPRGALPVGRATGALGAWGVRRPAGRVCAMGSGRQRWEKKIRAHAPPFGESCVLAGVSADGVSGNGRWETAHVHTHARPRAHARPPHE